MSLHRSLKTKPAALNQHRNVLTRAERIARLTEEGRFGAAGQSPLGLVKVANRQLVTKKKKKEEEEKAEGETAAKPS
jgi:small basic protein (TIGR04137 family)